MLMPLGILQAKWQQRGKIAVAAGTQKSKSRDPTGYIVTSAWCGEIVGTIYQDDFGVFQASMPFEYMERMEPQDRTSILYSFANDVAPFYIHTPV